MRCVKLFLMVALMFAACLRVANAGFIAEYSVPWLTGTTVGSTVGNPYADGAGNTWRYTQTNFSSSPNWTADAGRVSMVWGSDSQWHGITPSGGLPLVDDLDGVRMAGATDPYVGALEFTAANSGTYSFTGSFGAFGPNGTRLYFPVAEQTGAGPASLLAEINVTGDGGTFKSVSLDAITSLQDIALAAGDKLVFMVANKDSGNYTYANLSNMKIGYVPEPGTILLLISGAMTLLLLRRRW